ncbi:MarR family transcriptional regulator [Roseococcus sp. SYP-B2431]|uniref:MarR family winged helix-turn-helix transcriptional regulator n=1 Tax=Roseococcus sp. SYP-B2431 TaxID=2496640 RepID=UPI00103F6E58|nr:MarR family winged helix-turn-helix transcriptional regulator [Roseococcus sp. SYP-B2431]TCH96463.1 MarR family transcriptional regulator [Roseococcus sp. SYP-B2431]
MKKTNAVRKPKTEAKAKPGLGEGYELTVSSPILLSQGSDREFRRLVHNLFGFLARHEAIREGHGAFIDLAGIEYTVLISIAHLSAESDVSVRDVAEHLHLSGAFVTTVTNRLLAKGLVAKRTDPTDRRRLCLTVARQGRDLLATLAPTQRQVNDVQFEGISAEEFRTLSNLIERLIDSSGRALSLQRYLAENARASTPAKLPARRAG